MMKTKTFMFSLVMITITGLTLLLSSQGFAACPDDIVAFWKLDKLNPGGNYLDSINNLNGVGDGSLGTTSGVVKNAATFDGVTTGIDVPASRTFNWLSNESFSIEFWINMAAPPIGDNQVAVGRTGGDTGAFWFAGVTPTNGFVRFQLNDSSASVGLTGSTLVADGSWHHVVVVRDESTNSNIIYVDGAFDNSAMQDYAGDGFLFDAAPLNIGWLDHTAGEFRLAGSLDEIAVYDRALPLNEIGAHYTAGQAGNDYCGGSDAPAIPEDAPFPDDMISLWSLDEAVGSTYLDKFGDNHGNGNADPGAATGTVMGAQSFDGATTGIDVPASRTFNWLSNESFSIEFWINMAAPPIGDNQVAVGRTGGDTGAFWFAGVTATDGFVRFQLNDSSNSAGLTGSTTVADGVWHHVVVMRDKYNESNIIYVDGVSDASEVQSYSGDGFLFDAAPLSIGWLDLIGVGEFRLSGLLDEVALYDRALVPDEIEAHYTSGLAGDGVQTLRPAPVADAGTDQTGVKETTTVTLDGGASTPGYAGAAISTYLWEQTAGTTVTLSNPGSDTPTFIAPDVGAAGETLTFQLTVTASDGQSDSDTVTVGVIDGVPPVADAGDDQSVTEGEPVTLDGTGSTDANGSISTYLWVQTVGTTVTLSGAGTATATFTAPEVDADETLTFQLTVTDDDGLSHSDTTDVTVSNSSTPPPAGDGSSGGCFINTMF